MSRPFVWICLAFLAFALPSFAAVKGRGAHDHYFALEGEYVYLKRAKSRDRGLVDAVGNTSAPSNCGKLPGETYISSGDLVHNMGYEPGFRASLKFFYSLHSTWVLSYTGMLNWEGEKSVSCPQNLDLPGSLGLQTVDYYFADHAKTLYQSNFYTADLTYWGHITPRYIDHFSVSWMFGLRYLNIDEKLKLYFTRDNSTSRYRVKTSNWGFGPFFGGSLEYNPYYFLTWGVAGNAGAFYNRGQQKTRMLDEGNTVVIRDFSPSSSNCGYLLQVYPFIEYRPVKFFTFRVSYEALCICRVVLADYQLQLSGSGHQINHNGNVVYHGFFAGIQFNF